MRKNTLLVGLQNDGRKSSTSTKRICISIKVLYFWKKKFIKSASSLIVIYIRNLYPLACVSYIWIRLFARDATLSNVLLICLYTPDVFKGWMVGSHNGLVVSQWASNRVVEREVWTQQAMVRDHPSPTIANNDGLTNNILLHFKSLHWKTTATATATWTTTTTTTNYWPYLAHIDGIL